MEEAFRDTGKISSAAAQSLARSAGWGLAGGLVATLVMDLVLMGSLLIAGLPAFTCFTIVGDTVARLFSSPPLSSSIPLGMAAHYLVGPVLGALFGLAARTAPAAWVSTRKRTMLFAVLYAEILSQPLLALAPILLSMTAPDVLEWYGGSFAMHFIWGCVVGALWSQGMQRPVAGSHFMASALKNEL